MTTHRLRHMLGLFCTLCLLNGCTATDPEAAPQPESLTALQRLEDKADRFAQHELARYNAAELLYKNIPELHSTRVPINNQLLQGWTKSYRRFTQYTVDDIVQSDSLIAPIHYAITFHYEQYNTPYRKTDEAQSEQRCKADFAYTLRFTDTLTRRFACDQSGTLLEAVSELPARPLYFKKDYLRETTSMPSLP